MPHAEQATPSNATEQSSNLLFLSHPSGSSPAELAHDARNIVAALGLYCDLLEAPGVFTETYRRYGHELRTVANASRGLVDKLLTLIETEPSGQRSQKGARAAENPIGRGDDSDRVSKSATYWEEIPPTPIRDFSWELQSNRNLLAALAGPSVTLTVDAVGGALPVRLSGEDLTRILVNLIKNSVESMSGSGGRIQLILRECQTGLDDETKVLLNVEDNGFGIAPGTIERIFEPGFTTRLDENAPDANNRTPHRGLGLSIARAIVESAGGCIRAANRDPLGSCMQIELPCLKSK